MITALADAVVSELNGHSFTQTFAAARFYRPMFKPETLETLRVSVVPKAIKNAAINRTKCEYEVSIDVAVQKKLTNQAADDGPDENELQNAELDPLLALVEEIDTYLRLKRFASPDAGWIRSELAPIYLPDHLQQQRVFTSVLTITYLVIQ